MRDRLIDLLQKANETVWGFFIDGDIGILADHLISNGVIVLPFEIGKTVYDATEYFENIPCPMIYDLKHKEMTIEKVGKDRFLFTYDGMCIHPENIGKTLFFTENEAWKAIAERSKNDNT